MQQANPDLGPAAPESVSKPPWNPEEPESVEEARQNTIDDDLALVWHDSNTVSIFIYFLTFDVTFKLIRCEENDSTLNL